MNKTQIRLTILASFILMIGSICNQPGWSSSVTSILIAIIAIIDMKQKQNQE